MKHVLLPGMWRQWSISLAALLLIGVRCAAQSTEHNEDAQDGLLVENMDMEAENQGAFEEDLQDLFYPQQQNPNGWTGSVTLPGISPREVEAIRHHIKRFGPLYTIWELQAVEGISAERCRELVRYLYIPDPQKPYEPYTEILVSLGLRNESYGSTDHSVRIRGQTEKGILYHFTGDQDDGEPFSVSKSQVGYDHVSAGVDYTLPTHRSIRVLAGDYRAVFGQGLTLGQGFGLRKSVDLNLMARGTDQLRLHRSTSETMFMRGLALEHPGRNVHVALLGSLRPENATIHYDDITGEKYFQSFSTAANDVRGNRRKSVQLKEAALRISIPRMVLHPGFTVYLRSTDLPMFSKSPDGRLQRYPLNHYRRFGFDWNGQLGTFYLFGECTVSANKDCAIVAGVIKAINRNMDACLLYRNYAYDPVTYNRTGISAGSTASNEYGSLLAITCKLRHGYRLKWLTDIYTKPLPQGLSPGPVHGTEHIAQLSRKWSKTALVYVQVSKKVKTLYQQNQESRFKSGADHAIWNYRVHVEYLLSPSVRARIRVMGANDKRVSSMWSGLVYTDLRIKPLRSGSSLLLRWSIFTVPDYSLRLYVYENDVLYNHRIPAFGRDGARIFAIWSQKLGLHLQLQLKYGLQLHSEPDDGSYGAVAPDLRVLVRWKS